MSGTLFKFTISQHKAIMKSLTTISLITLGLAATKSAATLTGIYVCELPGWKGACRWNNIDVKHYGQCIPIDNKPQKPIVGFGVDHGIIVDMYTNPQCSGKPTLISQHWMPAPNSMNDLTQGYSYAAGFLTLYVKVFAGPQY